MARAGRPGMNLLRIVICVCLTAYAASDNDADPVSVPSETPEVIGSDATDDNSGTMPGSSLEYNASDGTTVNQEITSHSDTDADTIIVFSTTLEDENATSEIGSSTTYDDDFTIVSTVTLVDDEDISESNNSACFYNPCRSGGTCMNSTSVPYFICECAAGYVGIRCETTDNCVYDVDGQPCRNGFCAYSQDGLERACDCFVGHYWDNATGECREIKTVCDRSPCENGGMCNVLPGNTYNCSCEVGFSGRACEVTDWCDTDDDCGHGKCVLSGDRKTRSCQCDAGFHVQEQPHTCKAITTPCDSSPCKYGAVCSWNDMGYFCICEVGFSGRDCVIADWCTTNDDCGQGVCALSDETKIRSCKCNEGYYLEEKPHTCKKISNICQPNPCLHDGICNVLSANEYNCSCSAGYAGKKCEVRNMCIMDGGNAYCQNATCQNNYDLGIYFCTCPGEEYFLYTERNCTKVDLCPLMQCESNEKCLLRKCICKDNYERSNSTEKCEPNFCSVQPCPSADMTCEEGTVPTDYKCSCHEGYTFNGTHCNDALCIFPHLNPCQQICALTDDSGYECRCDENFKLRDDNKSCELIGNNTCEIKVCDKGSCVLKTSGEVCICPPGYVEVDGNCSDICTAAQIAPGICPSNECELTADGGFRCKCEGKFALSEDKTTCVVRNMCQATEVGWKRCKERNAECVQNWNTTEGFKCKCSFGQVETKDGICHDVCSMERNRRMCSFKGASCDIDREGNAICKCPPYFQVNEKDGKCNKPADVSYLITLPLDRSTYVMGNRMRRSLDASVDYKKISRDVKWTIEEMFVGFKQSNVLYCNPTSGYLLCKIELQFETEHETQLQRIGTEDICLTDENAKKCLLPPALVLAKERIGRDVVIEPTDPCEDFIKDENCGSETTCTSFPRDMNFNCTCKPGFLMRKWSYLMDDDRAYVESCRDVDECMDSICPPNSNCQNTIGSYTCKCMAGFRSARDLPRSDELKCVEICRPNPCTHGLCSRSGDHEFDCKCDAGYRGALCDLQDENFKREKNNSIILGVVLGGILLITFILFAVCVSRLRKRKCMENTEHMFYGSTEMQDRGRINNAFQRE